jgi:hypothetical protein
MNGAGKTPSDFARELNVLIQAAPERKLIIIQEFYARMVATGEKETADLVLTIRSIMEAGDPKKIPAWFQAAGFVCGACTLVFFMVLAGVSIFGHTVPQQGRFLVVVVFALGCALATTFLGGEAVASGKIPFFGESNPLAISATGGIAVLVISLVLGYYFYVKV